MKNKILNFIKQQPRWRVVAAGVLLLLLFIWAFSGGKKSGGEITFVVKRGKLQISVLEGGSIEALASQEIRSEVKGNGTKILKIVEEGYQVTEDDVKTNKVIVELDTAELKQRLTQQEIQFQSAVASFTDAGQGYEIQRNQNTSSIKAAEQKAQFARMDLEKFMGDKASDEIIRLLRFDKLEAAAAKIPSGEEAEKKMLSDMEINESSIFDEADAPDEKVEPPKGEVLPVSTAPRKKPLPPPEVDFSTYAKAELLGDGSARQQLRKLTDDLQSAQQQQSLSETKLAGTRRLFEKGFATKTEQETEEISYQNNDLKVKTAETAYNLFIKYEFPKQAQELVSKYEESLRSLEREKKEAISKLAQARARLKGAESRYSIEATQRKEIMEQIDKCLIKATKPGLVVYGGSSENYYGSSEQIREGATVRERQSLITIPDMSQMAVKIKVHESYIQKVKKGLKATITVDAFPDKKLNGEVIKVGLLPDSQNRWINPDLKVYQTTVSIEGAHEWLKPGMSAKVEIHVRELKDTLFLPMQAVSDIKGKQFCNVAKGGGELREIVVGDFNDEFIEVKSGLQEGEKVLLHAPENNEPDHEEDKSPSKVEEKSSPAESTPSATPQPEKKKAPKASKS